MQHGKTSIGSVNYNIYTNLKALMKRNVFKLNYKEVFPFTH